MKMSSTVLKTSGRGDPLAEFNLYQDYSHFENTEPHCSRALSINEETLETNYLNIAITFLHLATLYHYQSRYEQVAPLYCRCLAIFDTTLGLDYPNTQAGYRNDAAFLAARVVGSATSAVGRRRSGVAQQVAAKATMAPGARARRRELERYSSDDGRKPIPSAEKAESRGQWGTWPIGATNPLSTR